MANWLSTMQQTFEYYIVDPHTWKDVKRVESVLTSSINRDLNAETLGSASITSTESLGECYIRIYLITIQNGVREKHPLGTFLIQTPSYSFDGKIKNITMDAYTPLLELKENLPPLGYSILKGEHVLDMAYRIVREQVRAPVAEITKAYGKQPVVGLGKVDSFLASDSTTLTRRELTFLQSNFIANIEETWITFIYDLLENAEYRLSLDELGRVLFAPKQELTTLQPVWTYDDSNSSILHPTLDMDYDLYGIPNVVEVIYSNGTEYYYGRAVNDDPSSPTSIPSRGREITKRVTDPSLLGNPSRDEVQIYAERVLRELSTMEYTVSYTHGYCPVRIGDCVRLNYTRAGLNGVKAKVISQKINCEPGCPVTETATFTVDLWR